MARIGNKIGVRPADIGFGGLVDELKNSQLVIDHMAIELPNILASHKAAHHSAAAVIVREQVDRFRLAEGHARVLAD
ncbi:MAG: hypothetical protein AAFR82_12695, partial [Pseudomonadota bacterium]